MPTIPLSPGDYWRLRYLQERVDHAHTQALLLELRERHAHAAAWAALTIAYPALATSEQWTLTDAALSLSAPDVSAETKTP